MNPEEKRKNIKELKKLAAEVLELKHNTEQQRRPLLIEFCGSPKSGKTTILNSLNIFLKRNKFRTVILTERAQVCPVENKKHPFFNVWTLTSAISKIIEYLDQGSNRYDIIIADRGIFDALCWFEWLNSNPSKDWTHLADDTYLDLQNFILSDIWRKYIDLIYVFQVSPLISIEREYANLLTEERGSIMSEQVLSGFNSAIDSATSKFGKLFRVVRKVETDKGEMNNDPNLVSYYVTQNVLTTLKELLVEKIGYFDEELKADLAFGVNSFEKIQGVQLKFDNRDIVEERDFIQPIPIVVITNPRRDKLLVVKKNKKNAPPNSPEHEKLLPFIGGHMRQEDKMNEDELISIIENTLYREINEEIGESMAIKNASPFLIYTPNNHRSAKHIAVCQVVEMDIEDKKFKLTSDEFVKKSGTSVSGHVVNVEDIIKGEFPFESWGETILKYVFNKQVSKTFDLFD